MAMEFVRCVGCSAAIQRETYETEEECPECGHDDAVYISGDATFRAGGDNG